MKKLSVLAFVFFTLMGQTFAQGGLKANLDYNSFYIPGEGAYLETYLSVRGESVVFMRNANDMLQSKIEVSWKYTNAEGNVVHFDKYNLYSPEVVDGEIIDFNFLDQQRVPLKNGDYAFELTIKDTQSERPAHNIKQNFKINFYPNILALSDIQMLESYSPAVEGSKLAKSGFDLVPKIDYYYGPNTNLLKFYAEVYNANKQLVDKAYLLSYYIQSYETKQIIEKYRVFQRQQPERTTVVLSEIPIDDLPSGNYNLVLELRNQENVMIGYKEAFFQRNNAKVNEATLSSDFESLNIQNTFANRITDKNLMMEHISSLRPVSSPTERIFEDNQLKMANLELMQKFFYDFWWKRNKLNPEQAWLDYFEEVKKVEAAYATRIQRGYETDRGRVYLEYGPPNTISKNYREPSAYPYEIWHYYRLGNQNNRKFVFYNPDLVAQDFRLLHSDANGEPHEPRWQIILHERDNASRDMDRTQPNESYGGKSRDLFNNPR